MLAEGPVMAYSVEKLQFFLIGEIIFDLTNSKI
jgi:hypothetical protein